MLGAIMFAVAVGVGMRAIRASDGLIAAPELADWLLPYWLAVGIGSNDPDAVSLVRRTNGGRRYAMPFRVIPDRGQVSENISQPSTKQRCHVLQHRVPGSNQANGSHEWPYESRASPGKSGASASE